MWTKDHSQFEKLSSSCGNRYLAVKYISQTSRKLSRLCPRYTSESDLISWALHGKEFDNSKILNRLDRPDPDLATMYDTLCYIEDEEIKKCVERSYKLSVRNRHLTLCKDASNKYKLVRINILLRMIWASTT